MNRYETITGLGENFMALLGKGLVPVHILDWKVYYDAFLEEMEYQRKHFKKPRRTHAASSVAARYNITERTVFSVISFMEGD